jgi:hypothetical protein
MKNPGTETIFLDDPFTITRRSFVIPLPRGRALRFGWGIEAWCFVGPRRYTVVTAPSFVQSLEDLGIEDGAEWCRENGVLLGNNESANIRSREDGA